MFLGVISQLLVHLLAPPAVAQGDGHGALGIVLADDVVVQLGNNLPGRHVHAHARVSMVWLWLV